MASLQEEDKSAWKLQMQKAIARLYLDSDVYCVRFGKCEGHIRCHCPGLECDCEPYACDNCGKIINSFGGCNGMGGCDVAKKVCCWTRVDGGWRRKHDGIVVSDIPDGKEFQPPSYWEQRFHARDMRAAIRSYHELQRRFFFSLLPFPVSDIKPWRQLAHVARDVKYRLYFLMCVCACV